MTDQDDQDIVNITETGTKTAEDSPYYEIKKEMQELTDTDSNTQTSEEPSAVEAMSEAAIRKEEAEDEAVVDAMEAAV